MNILVIGSGGREHALCWKIAQSEDANALFCLPGNGGTEQVAVNVPGDISDHQRIADLCEEKNIDLVVIGPEMPLAKGLADYLAERGVDVFGPSHAASRLEASKIYAKEVMSRYNVPTAAFRIFSEFEPCEKYLKKIEYPTVVKAHGLAAGKGVFICNDIGEAVEAAETLLVKQKFGASGQRIIIEEHLEGEEVSILALTDGDRIITLASSQDHKRIGEKDTGANTGGMGAYSPAPVAAGAVMESLASRIIEPTIRGLKEEGIEYRGVLYAGVMMTEEGPKVLEFNVRFGDPEVQAILTRMKSDVVPYLAGAAKGRLPEEEIEWENKDAVCVVLASGGYPGEYEKGKNITGISEAETLGAYVFHAGTRKQDGQLITSGGRVLNVVALGEDIKKAQQKAYEAVSKIDFEGQYYRKDIAFRAIDRLKKAN